MLQNLKKLCFESKSCVISGQIFCSQFLRTNITIVKNVLNYNKLIIKKSN